MTRWPRSSRATCGRSSPPSDRTSYIPNDAVLTASIDASSPNNSTLQWACLPNANRINSPTSPRTVTDGSASLATIGGLPSVGSNTIPTGDDLTNRLANFDSDPYNASSSSLVEVAGFPPVDAPTDVLVVDEELDGVHQLVDLGDLRRRPDRRTAAHSLDELDPVPLGDPVLHLVGVPRRLGDDDADRAIGSALAHDEMRREVTRRPLTAQRRCVGPDLDEEIAQGDALVLGRVGVGCHGRTVPQERSGVSRRWR